MIYRGRQGRRVRGGTGPRRKYGRRTGFDHDRVSQLSLTTIRPSPENEQLYRRIDPEDPEILALAQSIRKHGVLDPLVVSADRFIISGHRRHAAAGLAGRKRVPCRQKSICRSTDLDGFLVLLREYNRHRDKSHDETLREEIISADPEDPYFALIDHREERSELNGWVDALELRPSEDKRRSMISRAKLPLLNAVIDVINEHRKYWPLSDRFVHYQLAQHSKPLKHASKPGSTYLNDKQSYKAVVDILTRGRLEGHIPWEAIGDETRPVVTWNVYEGIRPFVRREVAGFLKGYARDLLTSQPNQIEIVGEKMTLESIIRPVAMRYTVPYTIGRGYCSLYPRHKMAERYRKGGKDKLILLLLSDLDPDGWNIARSFAESMRDDFGIDEDSIVPIRLAITPEQVSEYGLPAGIPLKENERTTAKVAAFKEYFGITEGWELEAFEPADLQTVLGDGIDSVLDIEAFNAELDAEAEDYTALGEKREAAHQALLELSPDDDEEDEE